MSLIMVAKDLCSWNIRHPIPCTDPAKIDAYVRWKNAALTARELKVEGRITDVAQFWWDAVVAYFLKVWDLQMQKAEDAE